LSRGGEPVEAGVVVAEAHVVATGRRIEAFGVEPVRVVRLFGRVGGVGLVDAGELGIVVAAVRGVPVRGFGVPGSVSDLLDIAVRVVPVEPVLLTAIGVVFRLRQPLTLGVSRFKLNEHRANYTLIESKPCR
jgi:hypothetical protein